MDIKQAKKEMAEPLERNYMVISFNGHYDGDFIFEPDVGITVIQAFEKAEKYISNYSDESALVKRLASKDVTVNFISAAAYREAKLRHYLQENGDETT